MKAEIEFKSGAKVVGDFRGSDASVVRFRPDAKGSLLMIVDKRHVVRIVKVK